MKIDRNKIKLRRASSADIGTIIEYRITFLSETYGAASPELESRLRKSLQEYLKRSIENDSFISWVAEYENNPVGFSGMVIREQPGNFEIPEGRTGYILNMFTLKDFRNNGICKMLFQKLLDEAGFLNLEKIELHATIDGEPVYRAFGFTEPHDRALEKILENKLK
jgi:ribosomal protein S18 acetylase RimI-like enzyme